MEESLWKKEVRKNASTKGLGPCDRIEERVYTEEGKGVFAIKRRKGGSTSICRELIAKRVHLTLQITANVTSALCGKKGQQKEDGARLSPYKPVDDKKWIFTATYHRHTRWSREEKGVYKVRSEMGLQQCQN